MALLGRILRKENRDPDKVYLGAFGKHPAWDDFMAVPRGVDTGLGLETEPLLEIKRFLQNEGVLKFEERAQWTDLELEAWLEVFQHDFLWRRKGAAIVGRFWSSSDSKGRRLPMFVAIQASACPLARVLREFLPHLSDLERRCKSASSAAALVAVLDTCRSRLRGLAESLAGREDAPAASYARMAELARRPDWGADRVGFYRVLHQIERDTADYRAPKPGESAILWGPKARRPQHVRVPVFGESPAEECLVWTELLLETVHPATPILALMPRGKSFLDLIVGGPTAEELRCTIRSDIELPSDIPYKLRPEFVERAKHLISDWEGRAAGKGDGPRRGGPSSAAPGRSRTRLWKGLGLLGLCIAAVLSVFLLLRDNESRRWQEYCEDHASWLQPFLGDLNDERLRRYRSDPELEVWIADYEELKKKHNGIPDPEQVPAEKRALRADLIGLSAAIRKSLTTSGWSKLRRVEEAIQQYRERGWDSPANYLEVSLRRLSPVPRAPLAASIDRVLAIDRSLKKIEATWKSLKTSQDAIAQSSNPFLGSFEEHVRAQAAGAGDLDSLLERLAEAAELGDRLARVVRSEWERVATDALPDRLTQKPPAPLTRETYESWLREIPDYYRLAPDPRDDPKIDELLGRVEKRIGELESSSPALARESRRRCDELARKLRDDRQLAGIALNRGKIDENKRMRLQELDELAADLGGEPIVDADSRREWLAAVRSTSELSSLEVIDETYRQWRDRLLQGVTPQSIARMKIAEYSEIEARVQRLKESLLALDRALQSDAGEAGKLTGELASAYSKRRDAALRSAIAGVEKLASGGGPPDFGSLLEGPEFRELSTWVDEAAGLSRDFGRVTAWLHDLILLDDVPPGEEKTLRQLVQTWEKIPAFGDPAVQQALDPALAELKRLERIASLTERSELTSLAESADGSAAARLAAWRRLGQLKDPPWPGTAGELSEERRIGDGLRKLFSQLDATREKTLTRQLVAETARRWDSYFAGLEDHDEVGKAVASMGDFGVQREQIAPASRFKILVYELRSSVTSEAGSPTRERLQQFLGEVEKTLPEYSKRPGISDFLASLTKLAAESPAESNDRGPASSEVRAELRWTLQSDVPPSRVYAWKAPYGSHEEYTLEFQRLDASEAGDAPAYLCTTEVSVGVFIAVLRAAEGWSELGSLMTDRWIGPRGWRLTPSKVMTLSSGWLDPNFATGYPPGDQPGRPSSAHPMQRVSPHAGVYFARLLDCRFPTVSEWKRARAGDRAPPGARNLRDARWKRYLDHVSGKARSLEAFDPERVDAGRHVEGDDGFLWFAPVHSGPASPFYHLVGNVAEYTFDSPAAFEALNDLQVQSILSFVADGAGEFGVIGGSALSPPALDVETVHRLPNPIRKTKTGFSDVGIRLAFTAPKASLATGLNQILVETGYSWK